MNSLCLLLQYVLYPISMSYKDVRFVRLPLFYPPALPTAPPSITSLMSCNITGISFSVYWSSQSRSNQTYEVILSKGSEVIDSWVIDQTIKTLLGLNPGVVYSVTVIPRACERQGAASQILVRTGME